MSAFYFISNLLVVCLIVFLAWLVDRYIYIDHSDKVLGLSSATLMSTVVVGYLVFSMV